MVVSYRASQPRRVVRFFAHGFGDVRRLVGFSTNHSAKKLEDSGAYFIGCLRFGVKTATYGKVGLVYCRAVAVVIFFAATADAEIVVEFVRLGSCRC